MDNRHYYLSLRSVLFVVHHCFSQAVRPGYVLIITSSLFLRFMLFVVSVLYPPLFLSLSHTIIQTHTSPSHSRHHPTLSNVYHTCSLRTLVDADRVPFSPSVVLIVGKICALHTYPPLPTSHTHTHTCVALTSRTADCADCSNSFFRLVSILPSPASPSAAALCLLMQLL